MDQLTAMRKEQLRRISELRGGRDVIVIAADLRATGNGINPSLEYGDILPVADLLKDLSGHSADVILETPGGSGEVAEEIVRMLHDKYADVAFIVPGWAKSAGTIMVMAGDEILMGPASALGPIDAQIGWQGKVFSADALIEGLDKIKREVVDTGTLNKAYIPMLSNLSPGELQHAEDALQFAKDLVRDWLVRYKFKDWNTHASTGAPVTDEERNRRAREVADQLCDQRRWKTHGRSIRIEDLKKMRVRITDYTEQPDLADAIDRYAALLRMTFDSNIFKVLEDATHQVYRAAANPAIQPGSPAPEQAEKADINVECGKCHSKHVVQIDLRPGLPLQDGRIAYPASNLLKCPRCGNDIDLTEVRRQIELMTKKSVVPRGDE
ncbi:MAG: Clp protease ClpP [Actinobacteria bacterium HGW-Actinobacteria-1]|jgi:ClpP class serine protease|nr:MAG: Clp protease ClpP [Actinobacteria bacterium HGW-Actinobacteria-1]